jgi:hypothetical protein
VLTAAERQTPAATGMLAALKASAAALPSTHA